MTTNEARPAGAYPLVAKIDYMLPLHTHKSTHTRWVEWKWTTREGTWLIKLAMVADNDQTPTELVAHGTGGLSASLPPSDAGFAGLRELLIELGALQR